MAKRRLGRLSKEDWAYIRDNHQVLSSEQIAQNLGKRIDAVENYINKYLKGQAQSEKVVKHELKDSEYWPDIQEQFTEQEQEVFLKMWGEIAGQFAETEIYSTEKIQIIDVIKMDILMNRNLKQQKNNMEDIKRLETMSEEVDDKEERIEIDQRLSFARNNQNSLVVSYRELQDKKNKIWKDLKATRADRVKEIQESKKTLAGWINELMKNRSMRLEAGKWMEKNRLAAEKEYKRLAELHTFGEGSADSEVKRPILNEETVYYNEE